MARGFNHLLARRRKNDLLPSLSALQTGKLEKSEDPSGPKPVVLSDKAPHLCSVVG